MERETITIEIKQEVSITLVWIAAGVALLTGVFCLSARSPGLWPAVNMTGIASLVFLALLLAYALRRPIGWKTRIVAVFICVMTIGATGYTWLSAYERSDWSADRMMRMRESAGRGIRMMEITPLMLKVLDAYHRQGVGKKLTLAEEFRKLKPGVQVGSEIYKTRWDWDSMNIIVERIDPDRIELVSQETFVRGRNPAFQNHNGQKGMVQERYILTERGIEHVSEN